MWNFEENFAAKGIILRYTSKPERGLFIFNPLINFFTSIKQEVDARAIANDANKHIDWLIFLVKLWLDQGFTGCHVKWTLATPHRSKLEKAALLVNVLPQQCLKTTQKNRF